mmetsp:Transcript_93778/g.262355  ORF Transcript_93778/g.262355 Transcript_93778/m.262355 type:complete len:277 (-) Transcript_93778:482-1312(-)
MSSSNLPNVSRWCWCATASIFSFPCPATSNFWNCARMACNISRSTTPRRKRCSSVYSATVTSPWPSMSPKWRRYAASASVRSSFNLSSVCLAKVRSTKMLAKEPKHAAYNGTPTRQKTPTKATLASLRTVLVGMMPAVLQAAMAKYTLRIRSLPAVAAEKTAPIAIQATNDVRRRMKVACSSKNRTAFFMGPACSSSMATKSSKQRLSCLKKSMFCVARSRISLASALRPSASACANLAMCSPASRELGWSFRMMAFAYCGCASINSLACWSVKPW